VKVKALATASKGQRYERKSHGGFAGHGHIGEGHFGQMATLKTIYCQKDEPNANNLKMSELKATVSPRSNGSPMV